MTPELDAYATASQTVVWCRYCRIWHAHGAGASGDMVAHCTSPGSPYRETGYILRPAGLFTEEVRQLHAHEERGRKRRVT